MIKRLFLSCAAAALASCNQGSNDAATNATASAAAPKPKRASYCFFKDEEAKGWKASLDASGNVTVAGKMHVKDARYKAELGQPEVTGTSADLWQTLAVNTSYASPDNWWDVNFTIPNSAAVTNVAVRCGRKTMAELTIKRAA
jgi:hypothetical protein